MGLGHTITASTIWLILNSAGIDPAPQRSAVTWSQFLRSQAAAACDFATIDTVTLRRFYLLFHIHIPTRTVYLGGITEHPTGAWTTQAARNLFLGHGHQPDTTRALVRGQDSQFIDACDEIFHTEGSRSSRPRSRRRPHTRSPNDGSAPCAESSWIAPSSGTNASSNASPPTTSTTTTNTGPPRSCVSAGRNRMRSWDAGTHPNGNGSDKDSTRSMDPFRIK